MDEELRKLITIIEAKSHGNLELVKLPYSRGALTPVMSKSTVDYHYGELAKGYVDRYNKKEGDATFNEAGAYLHNLLFPQFQAARPSNQPRGSSLLLIEKKHGSFKEFKEAIKEEAMKIQGSGWIYMSRSGDIKVIKNHQKRTDIALLIDWWEHAYNKDYGSNKSKYIDNIWRIINWDIINQRL